MSASDFTDALVEAAGVTEATPTAPIAVRERGITKWFNNEKCFGFIERKSGEDVFVHYSAIIMKGYKSLSEGQPVEFEVVKTAKGLNAIHVVPME